MGFCVRMCNEHVHKYVHVYTRKKRLGTLALAQKRTRRTRTRRTHAHTQTHRCTRETAPVNPRFSNVAPEPMRERSFFLINKGWKTASQSPLYPNKPFIPNNFTGFTTTNKADRRKSRALILSFIKT